ncbi:hypothetical protein C2G38_2228945 [Gigaspora rosea]|uniref:C2H2-type domain-containing protein n=1 Tax=Gigaspora rosea TaxID=44941 RepID=A0A397TZW6_9GLOM|nr:hypothetical protein C2G38_2228945 [Gigaspora rosea]CAG8743382.1 13788_t:CDS:2 [Gigaspora rosea]
MLNELKCLLCGESFASRKEHLTHERTKHKNNKIIPQRYLFPQPSLSQITYYQNAFIVLLKNGWDLIDILYEYWDFLQDPLTQTKGYVLLADNEVTYEIIFSWTQTELKEND